MFVEGAHAQKVEVVQCAHCAAFVPLFKDPVSNTVDEQVAFHDTFWQDETPETLGQLASQQRNMVGRLRKHLGEPGKALIAEIGCGRGSLLKALLLEGYKARGCEPSEMLSSKAHEAFGFSDDELIRQTADAFLQDAIDTGTQYDAVVLWHVLEHLEHPVQILARTKRTLAPKGRIVLQVPLLHKPYIYREHLFLCNRSNLVRMGALSGLNLVHYSWSAHEFYATAVFSNDPSDAHVQPYSPSFASDWQAEMSEISQILISGVEKQKANPRNNAATKPPAPVKKNVRPHSVASVQRRRAQLASAYAEKGPLRTLVGLHIPKCAGTSLLGMVEDRLSPEQIYQNTALIKNWSGDREELLLRNDFSLIRFAWGHWVRDQMLRLLSRPIMFTGMRDPRERIISAYHFELRLRKAQGRAAPVLDRWLPGQKNFMSQFIIQRFPGLAQGETDFERARSVLRCFHGVYFTDNLQAFTNRLMPVILKNVPEVGTRNQRTVEPDPQGEFDIPDDIVAEDEKLYSWARETFYDRDPLADPIDKFRMEAFQKEPADMDSLITHSAQEIANELANFGRTKEALALLERREAFLRELRVQVSKRV